MENKTDHIENIRPQNGNEHRGKHHGHRGGAHHHGNRPPKDTAAKIPMEEAVSEAPASSPKNVDRPEGENAGGRGRDRHGRNRHGKNRGYQRENRENLRQEDSVSFALQTPTAKPQEDIVVPEFDLAELPMVFRTLEECAADEDSAVVVGVRFVSSGKTYYFDPGDLTVTAGQHVIVETARGPEYAEAAFGNKRVPAKNIVSPLRTVLRLATPADDAADAENHKKEKEAFDIAVTRISAHKLDMKLVEAQYAFDRSKLLFYFTSGGRVDFRDLVKDLASIFRTRIELRQIGIRDEARMLGGIGACGRALCCSTFLPDFTQVAIKMVKEQNLSMNSGKISGNCGRLMCCLDYEYATYEEALKVLPPVGSTVETPDGVGTVIGLLPLSETMKVSVCEKNKNNETVNTVKNYTASQIRVISFAAPNQDGEEENGRGHRERN